MKPPFNPPRKRPVDDFDDCVDDFDDCVDDFDGIVFDLDGVLLDSWQLYLGLYRNVFADLVGREFSDEELIGHARTTESGTLSAVLSPSRLTEGFDRLKYWYPRLFDDLAPPYPEAVAALRAAHDRGKKVGIFTGKTRFTAEFSLERLGVADVVDSLSSEDDYETPKPHPGGLLRILKRLDLEPERTLFIGDQKIDLLAGREAHTATAAARWAVYTTIDRDDTHADLFFPTARSCLDFFDHISNG